MIQTEIFLALVSNAAVEEIIGRRFYPMRLPQGGALPAAVYQIITTAPVNSLDGDSGLDAVRLQIKSWATTYAGAQALAAAIRTALTSAGTLKIVTQFSVDDEDQETRSFCVIAQYTVWSESGSGASSPLAGLVYYAFSGDGTTTNFTFPHPFKTESLLLFRNGVLATKGVQYEELADRSGVSFTKPPEGGAYKDEFVAFFATAASQLSELAYYAFSGDGVTTDFTLPYRFKAGSLLVFRNGALAKKNERYTEEADRTGITFTTAPEGGAYKDEFVAFFAKD